MKEDAGHGGIVVRGLAGGGCRRASHRRCVPRGFTLVEMVVAIGIVVFLAGLTVTAANALLERAEVSRTENTLKLLDTALDEWERAASRKLTWGAREGVDDIWSDRAHTLIISELLEKVRPVPDAAVVLAKIEPELVYRYTEGEVPRWIEGDPLAPEQVERFANSITVLDAWGTPIYATHPGAVANPPMDEDGTERTANEWMYGIALNRRVCFVSAGPDGLFGLPQEFQRVPSREREMRMEAARADNLYSYHPRWVEYRR